MPKVVGQDQNIYKRITCRHCGAINEYTPNEVRLLFWKTHFDLSTTHTYGFNCAECKDEVFTKID